MDEDHIKKEEDQWKKIISSGNPEVGLILIMGQKLCALTHEVETVIKESSFEIVFWANRLINRIDALLDKLVESGLEDFDVFNKFIEIKEKLQKIKGVNDFNPEEIHQASHALCGELEKYVSN